MYNIKNSAVAKRSSDQELGERDKWPPWETGV